MLAPVTSAKYLREQLEIVRKQPWSDHILEQFCEEVLSNNTCYRVLVNIISVQTSMCVRMAACECGAVKASIKQSLDTANNDSDRKRG